MDALSILGIYEDKRDCMSDLIRPFDSHGCHLCSERVISITINKGYLLWKDKYCNKFTCDQYKERRYTVIPQIWRKIREEEDFELDGIML